MKESSGFTLLEMLVVIAILGMTIMAVPAMGTWSRQGVLLATDQLRADIQLARMMAIKQKRNCAIVIHAPGPNRYLNSLNRQWVGLSQFRGGVHFLDKGPEGSAAASEIIFNRQGMSTSVVPREVFLADEDRLSIYRVQVRLPGGISVHRWGGGHWL